MKITIEDIDLKNAQESRRQGRPITESCLVYQAMNRHGLEVTMVGYSSATTKSYKQYGLEGASEITLANSKDWPRFVGYSFTALQQQAPPHGSPRHCPGPFSA